MATAVNSLTETKVYVGTAYTKDAPSDKVNADVQTLVDNGWTIISVSHSTIMGEHGKALWTWMITYGS